MDAAEQVFIDAEQEMQGIDFSSLQTLRYMGNTSRLTNTVFLFSIIHRTRVRRNIVLNVKLMGMVS